MGQTKLIEDEGCKLCPLHETRNNIVWIRGTSEKDVDIVLVGEAPGRDEDLTGKPFVGKAGRLLDKWIEDAELTSYAIVNIVKCRPPANRKPLKSEIRACLPHLMKQLHDLNPKLIIALGATPSSVLVNRTEIVVNIGKLFKSKYGTTMIFPHPAYIARGVDVYVPIKELREIAKKLEGG